MSVVRKFMAIGKVVEKLAPKIALVEVQTNDMDPYIQMYFSRFQQYRADDRQAETKVGDLVLIKSKDTPERLDLLHDVSEVVQRVGQIRDPLTGRRVIGDKDKILYLENLQRLNKLLPDFIERPGLVYDEKDVEVPIPPSARDKT